jgi:hypothetical protein
MTRHTAPTGHPCAATAEVAALGPFFAFTPYRVSGSATRTAPRPAAGGAPAEADTGAVPPAIPGSGLWQPLDGPALAERVTAVRRYLASAAGGPPESVEVRVAASVAHLGLAARLLSPEAAAAVLHGRLFAHPLRAVRWQPALGGPPPLALPDSAPAEESADTLAERFARRLGHGPLAELAAAHRPFGVSPHILLGNTASALNGAAAMIAAARPELAARARAFASAVLDREPLRAQADRTAAGGFRRRSCCLVYRAAPGRRGALCGDCALRPRGGRA